MFPQPPQLIHPRSAVLSDLLIKLKRKFYLNFLRFIAIENFENETSSHCEKKIINIFTFISVAVCKDLVSIIKKVWLHTCSEKHNSCGNNAFIFLRTNHFFGLDEKSLELL